MTPANPCPVARATSERTRTDFEATRTGTPSARLRMSSALVSNASRSTTARGAGSPDVAADSRATVAAAEVMSERYSPARPGVRGLVNGTLARGIVLP